MTNLRSIRQGANLLGVTLFLTLLLGLSIACSRATETSQVYQGYSSQLAASGLSGSDLLDASREMRVAVATQLKSAILNRYANIELKNERIKTADGKPFDSLAHIDNCIDIESKTNDSSDLRFIDRMKVCIAAFQDTHFGVGGRNPVAGVSVGILIRNVGGKYVIVATQKDLLKHVAQVSSLKDLDKVLAIGNEVLEVDGQPPAKLAEHYKAFISSSSPAHRQMIADTAILNRNFDYPVKANVRLKIKSPTTTYDYEIPWWASTAARNRLDTSEYFKKIGIPVTDRVRMYVATDGKADWKKVPLVFKGYLDSNPLVPEDVFRPLIEFKNKIGEDADTAARLGTVAASGQVFCYAQFLTFSTDKLFGPDGSSLEYVETVRRFIKSCKTANLDLVIDLRSNGGGNGGYPTQILSLLTPEGTTLGTKVMAFRVSRTSARLISSAVESPEIAAYDMGKISSRMLEEFEAAAAAGLSMTGAIPESLGTKADTDVGGYRGKVIALVTPNCVSACEGLASILKRSGRAVILGTHTNGTGAGYQASDKIDSGFTDTFDELTTKIPNYQFGYTNKAPTDLASVPYASVRNEYFSENMPTVADITVEPTLDDVVGKKNTWLEATLKALAAPVIEVQAIPVAY